MVYAEEQTKLSKKESLEREYKQIKDELGGASDEIVELTFENDMLKVRLELVNFCTNKILNIMPFVLNLCSIKQYIRYFSSLIKIIFTYFLFSKFINNFSLTHTLLNIKTSLKEWLM